MQEAAKLLDVVRVLQAERPRWMKLVALDVGVTSAVDGAVTMRWLVDDAVVRQLLIPRGVTSFASLPGETLLLPVFTSERVVTPIAERISMVGLSGCHPLTGLHCDTLRRVAELPPNTLLPHDHDHELAVPLRDADLGQLTELVIAVPFRPQDNGAPSPAVAIRRPFAALNPVGVIDVAPLWDLAVPAAAISVALPEEVHADAAVLTVATGLDERIETELVELSRELSDPQHQVLKGPIVARQLELIVPVVRRAAAHLTAEQNRLRRISPPGVDARKAQKALATSSKHIVSLGKEIERRAAKAQKKGHAARLRTTTIVALVDDARREYTRLRRLRMTTSLSAAAAVDDLLVAPCPPAFPLKEIKIVYSTKLDVLRQRRLGTTRALFVMGVVLLLLAWRLQTMMPLKRHDTAPIEVVQAEALRSSRDALVALLVIFPALLYTQLERIGADRRLFDPAVSVALTCASAAFLAPVAIGVLALGDVRPSLVIHSCLWVGAAAIGLSLFVGALLSERALTRLRALSCRTMVTARKMVTA